MMLRQAEKKDLAAIHALQNAIAPERRKMTLETIGESLFAASHEHGKNTALACAGEDIRGVCGWVRGNTGEFFMSPFFTADTLAAETLSKKLLQEAQGSKWVRVSCFPEEMAKRAAFVALGFAPEFDFVEYECVPRNAHAPKIPVGITEVPLNEADPALFRELMNLSFAGVDNSLPLTEEMAKEILSSPQLDSRLSLLWKNSVGRYTSFVVVEKNGYLDSIGIHPEAQKLGYGSLLYKRALAFAAEKKIPRIYTTVSSRNIGSLRLHQKLGIPEVERRTVLQKNL